MSDFHEDELLKNDEGDDVEAHSALDARENSALGEVMANDEGDDVEAHSLLSNNALGDSALSGTAMGEVMRDSDDDKRSDVL